MHPANRPPVPDGTGGWSFSVTQQEMQAAEKRLQKELQSHQQLMRQVEEDLRNNQVHIVARYGWKFLGTRNRCVRCAYPYPVRVPNYNLLFSLQAAVYDA